MSALLGVRLTVLAGPTVPVPLSPRLLTSLAGVEVTHADDGRSGFQLTLQSGRGADDLLDHAALASPQLRPSARVVLVVTFGLAPMVLMDGIVTNTQLQPGDRPGRSTVTITGEDVSVMMDREERSVEHPAQPEIAIATKIIASYAAYGLVPVVIPPIALDVPLPIERTPTQQGTDLAFLRQMAERFAHVFYVTPGPVPLTNTAYWGPPVRAGLPQPALTVDMGAQTNVTSIDFQHDAPSAVTVTGQVQDRTTNATVPVTVAASARPPLAAEPAAAGFARTRVLRASGATASQAFARAQATVDAAADVVTAEGELDAGRYGGVLTARGLVGVRGAGSRHDGLYYVKRVTHRIGADGYRQRFTLTRDGVGSTVPVVRT